jgi:RimJ/RimL family protein N-acetyltransferase
VSRFLGGVRTPQATAAYLETNLRHWADHGLGLWTLRTQDGAFVGRAGLRYVEVEGVRELEIAYAFVKNA